jgi:hypothetical protein
MEEVRIVPNAGLAADFGASLLPSLTQRNILSHDLISNRRWQQDWFASAGVKGRITTRQVGDRQLGSENEYERRLLRSDLKGILDKVGDFSVFLPALTMRPLCIISNRVIVLTGTFSERIRRDLSTFSSMGIWLSSRALIQGTRQTTINPLHRTRMRLMTYLLIMTHSPH